MAKRGGRGRAIANNSVSDDKAEFFKVFLPDENSHQIMIPTDYMTYFSVSRTIGERVTLKDADGKIWHVTVVKTQDGFFLKNGWQRFVNHHLLSYGEFLVFKYEENYSFVVKIYGINACKKGNFAANYDDITTRVKVEENDTEENDTEEEMNDKQTLGKHARRLNKETDISFDSSGCPFFVSQPLRDPKQYRFRMPTDFVKKHNRLIESEMVLRDAEGKEWDVQVSIYDDGRVYIGNGWSRFRIDNNLGLKDRCKYTFGAEKSSRIIRVQVLRARQLNEETDISFDTSECPCFVSRLIHPKQYRVQIPKEVLKEHNVRIESEMVLRDAKGEEWVVQTTILRDGRVFIGRGWSHFRIDNNLVMNDRCRYIFGPDGVIRVQVLRDGST